MSKETKGQKLLQQTADRRQVLKVTIAGAATLLLLPTKWSVPTVQATEVHEHARASAPPTARPTVCHTTKEYYEGEWHTKEICEPIDMSYS